MCAFQGTDSTCGPRKMSGNQGLKEWGNLIFLVNFKNIFSFNTVDANHSKTHLFTSSWLREERKEVELISKIF